MFLTMTEVKPSLTHGLGVFAAENIKKGAVVYQHRPTLDLILNATEFAELDDRDRALILHYGGIDKRLNRYRLPYDNLRFLNHSNSPNLHYEEIFDQIVALRDIRAGEELLQDYHDFEVMTESRFANFEEKK